MINKLWQNKTIRYGLLGGLSLLSITALLWLFLPSGVNDFFATPTAAIYKNNGDVEQSGASDKANIEASKKSKQQTTAGSTIDPSQEFAVNDPRSLDWSGDDEEKVPVYVIGAVKTPGIYLIGISKLIGDAITMAGGAGDDADLEVINLAAKIVAHQSIRVPTKDEVKQGLVEAPVGIAGAPSLPNGKKININTASKTVLETLPGIGPMTAAAIIEYRQTKGPFKVIEDLTKVPGIKQSRFEPLKSFIAVDG